MRLYGGDYKSQHAPAVEGEGLLRLVVVRNLESHMLKEGHFYVTTTPSMSSHDLLCILDAAGREGWEL